jgi:hypothetical protein
VVLRAGHRGRQAVEPELGEAGEKLLEVLAAEEMEDESRGLVLAPAGDQSEDEAGQQRLVQNRDRPVAFRQGFFSRTSS